MGDLSQEMQNIVNFVPPGPVGGAFMDCRLFSKFIMGPVGSGKTSCMIVDTIKDAGRQKPSKVAFEMVGGARLPIRFTKALFVRETFRQLEGTTIPSWLSWMPKKAGEWKGGTNSVATHELKFMMPPTPDFDAGTIVDLTVIFDALGEQNVEALFKGKEFNLLRLNEADTLRAEIYAQGTVRVRQGRYPGERHVDPADCVKNIGGDFNAPDPDNWLWTLLTENKPVNCGFFRQPGGLDPNAENRKRASEQDYRDMEEDLIAQGRKDLARRNVHNLPGFSRAGEPVYTEYRDDFHCAGDELQAVEGLPIKVSCDQGLHPAAILRQTLPNGQRRVLEEIYCDTGAKGLADEVKRVMALRYPGFRLVGGLCDPAGNARDPNDPVGSGTWLDAVNRFLGLEGRSRIRPAPTNSIEKCTSAVRVVLTRLVDGGQPGLLISNRCKVMRKGLNSAYCYKKSKQGTVNKDKPVKVFPVSDVLNTLEFDCMDEGGYEDVVGRAKRAQVWGKGKQFQAKVSVSI